MLTTFRRRTALVKNSAATAAQTLPEDIAYLLDANVGGSAVGTVGASLAISDAATSTATPHVPTDAITLSGAAVLDEIVETEYVGVGDISRWQ